MTLDLIRDPAGTMTVLPPETITRREIDHRVANSLQLISSLLSLQAKQAADASVRRSEEHTSELQSLMRISYAVFCLKKKKYNNDRLNSTQNNTQLQHPA